MKNESDVQKIIQKINATKGSRKYCTSLHQTLSSDGYVRSIVNWTRVTKPERIDALVEHIEKCDAEVKSLSEQVRLLTEQRDAVVAESSGIQKRMQQLVDIINNADNSYCMCGDPMKNHGYGGCGSPTGMFDYHYGRWSESEITHAVTDAILDSLRAEGVEMFAKKCSEKSKQAISSDTRDNWWLCGEHADDFACQLRESKGANHE